MSRREIVERTVEACLDARMPDVDLREVTIVGGPGDPLLRVVIDHPEGVDHDLCARVTYALEGAGLRDEHAIEVSSPGEEPPLRTRAHFEQAVGQRVRVRVADPAARRGWRERTGELVAVENGVLTLAHGEGVLQISMDEVRRAHAIRQIV